MSVARKPRPMPGTKEDMERAAREIMGGGLYNRFAFALDLREIAEEEVDRAYPREKPTKRYPAGKPTEPEGLLNACCPSDLFYQKSEKLYRHHVRELIARSREKRPDYSLATEAEVLIGMLGASQIAPLNSLGMCVVDRLFPKIMGKAFTDKPTPEQWAHQFDESLLEARRKVRTGR